MRSPIRYLLTPTCLCLILSATHFIHNHQHIYATLCVMSFISLIIRHPICLRLNQVAMLLLSIEWLHTLVEGYHIRANDEQTWPQIALLIVLVAALHLSCAVLLQHHRIRHYFGYPRQYIFR